MSQAFDFGQWLVGAAVRRKLSVLRKKAGNPSPSETWVLGEEHPDSINDAAMANQMAGNPGDPAPKIIDYPASSHGGAGVFALADGHCLSRKWLGRDHQTPRHRQPAPARE